jgi:hypothetical protein
MCLELALVDDKSASILLRALATKSNSIAGQISSMDVCMHRNLENTVNLNKFS